MASTVAFSHALSARAATSVRGSNDKKVHARRATATTASKPRSLVVRTDRRDRARTDGSTMRCVGGNDTRVRERGTTRTRERAMGTRARIILARDHRDGANAASRAGMDGCARVGPSRVTGALSARDRDARSGVSDARARWGRWGKRVIARAGVVGTRASRRPREGRPWSKTAREG